MRGPLILAGFVIVFLLTVSLSARAQQTLGSVKGTVSDSSGAVIPQTAIKIRSPNTNFEVSVKPEATAPSTPSICRLERIKSPFRRRVFKARFSRRSWFRATGPLP